MKKSRLIALLIALLVLASGTATAHADSGITSTAKKAGKGYLTIVKYNGRTIARVRTAKRVKVKVIDTKKLTARGISGRRNKYILIEKVRGKCVNNRGDGRTSTGYYISYRGVKGHKKGHKYTTWLVYDNSSSIDAVIARADKRTK